jgi:hypothetical protein
VRKPKGKKSLERPRRRWEDNIKVGLPNVRLGMNYVDLVQDRERWRALLIAVTNFPLPQNERNFLTGSESASVTGRTLLNGTLDRRGILHTWVKKAHRNSLGKSAREDLGVDGE